jgi:hypothetical protein
MAARATRGLHLPERGPRAQYSPSMKDPIRWTVLAVIMAAVAASLYFWQQRKDAAPQPPSAHKETPPAPAAKPAPQIEFPLPQAADSLSLPTLDQSDSTMREGLASLFGRNIFEQFFQPQNVIRRIVATVDNLPREKLALRLMPVKPVAGPLLLTGAEENRVISAQNSARYLPYVLIAESVEAGKLVAIYVHHYPLFQQAYRELGYPSGYFNDRLVQVIDHLLAAPEIGGPIRLAQRKVLYEFADRELEARSAGQKILIRIGSENAARVKAKLREIRRGLTGQLAKP